MSIYFLTHPLHSAIFPIPPLLYYDMFPIPPPPFCQMTFSPYSTCIIVPSTISLDLHTLNCGKYIFPIPNLFATVQHRMVFPPFTPILLWHSTTLPPLLCHGNSPVPTPFYYFTVLLFPAQPPPPSPPHTMPQYSPPSQY